MIAGERDWAWSGAARTGPNVVGAGDRATCADERFQVWGRSFVIHMLWNGFLLVLSAGAGGCDAAGAGRPTAEWRPRGSACAPTPGAGPDQAAGSGRLDAANWGRSDEPAISAMNTPRAATIAVAGRHRRV
ncbi:hypothetical protein [Mycobacterium intracellulare]|uniref:Uncharacterized protein n=1 Tax=Mycobacterium intracellulare subsp. chimaera TaxID=222805 RepID=A0ABT7NWJ3_MYCIT|nr:hypothetical protein [Mycobacterium intracellulare]MDM3925412.1 hypothetical protein [Mycobacterium intracellulare subsp. chimaera]